MKAIRLSALALTYRSRRGFSVAEVEEAIREVGWVPAEVGRVECRKVFHYNRVRTENSTARRKCGVSLSLFGGQPYGGSRRGRTIESQKWLMSRSGQARGLRRPSCTTTL